jgi:hypothetical protein
MAIEQSDIERLLAPLEPWQIKILAELMQRMRDGKPFRFIPPARLSGQSWLRMVAAVAVQWEHQQQHRQNLIDKGLDHLARAYPTCEVRYVRDLQSFTVSPIPLTERKPPQ